jgi:5-methyltetrahydrofolate--homocysteine methyltransferase
MLYGKHLGVRGLVERLLAAGDAKALEVHEIVEALKRDAVDRGLLEAQGVYRWYRARAAGDAVILFDSSERETARFEFPSQRAGERLCLADYVRDDVDDHVALFAVTCGGGVRELAAEWKERGEYVRSHALQALAIESAEAFAEMLHSRIRTLWGFPDPPDLPISEKLKAHYRGIRVSFGYPACPNLADQVTLFRLLEPQTFGLTLTEGFMMDPEASVSGLVFHHPAAKYFKAD